MSAIFLHVVRVKGRKLQAVAGVTYPEGATTCIARADSYLKDHGYARPDGQTTWAGSVEAQKNYAGRADNFVMHEVAA